MPIIETQRTIAGFVAEHNLATSAQARLLDLTAEVGELAKEVLKGSSYGRVSFQPTPSWADELGDCLFSLVCLANATEVDLDAAIAGALDKYRRRLARAGDAGSGR